MHHLILKSTFVGLATLAALVLDEQTAIPVVAALVVAAAWGRGLWWLGRKFQSLEDDLKVGISDRAEIKKVMAELISKVNSLPCKSGGCETDLKSKLDK